MEQKVYRVLIVEDEPASQRLLTRFIEKYGYIPYTASTVDEAKAIIQSSDIVLDAILLDLNLQEATDGMELLAWLGKNAPKIPVIVETCYSDELIIKQAIKLGAKEYLEKPVWSSRLHNIFATLLEKRVAFL